MDAPLCKLCEKRHYGMCASGHVPVVEKPDKSSRPKKKSKKIKIREGFFTKPPMNVVDATIAALLARVESLEARVLELEARKKYMREYQRTRRSEGKA